MDHNEHRRLQQTILDQVVCILKSDPHVLGLVFAGSFARGVSPQLNVVKLPIVERVATWQEKVYHAV